MGNHIVRYITGQDIKIASKWNLWKLFNVVSHQGKRKLRFSSSHSLQWLRSNILTIMSVVGNRGEQPELSYIVGGSIKWYNHFGKQFLSFSKKKKTKEEKQENLYSQWLNDSTPGYSFKRNNKMYMHTKMCVWINITSFIEL